MRVMTVMTMDRWSKVGSVHSWGSNTFNFWTCPEMIWSSQANRADIEQTWGNMTVFGRIQVRQKARLHVANSQIPQSARTQSTVHLTWPLVWLCFFVFELRCPGEGFQFRRWYACEEQERKGKAERSEKEGRSWPQVLIHAQCKTGSHSSHQPGATE